MTARSPSPDFQFAVAPDGEAHPAPTDQELARQEARMLEAAVTARTGGREIVVIQGLGFVGTAVAAVVAQARREDGSPRYLVIGTDLLTAGGWWKVARINQGRSPFASPDPELAPLVRQAALEAGNLLATVSEKAYALADVIMVDVPLDVADRTLDAPDGLHVDLGPFQAAIRTLGRTMGPDTLVLVETTVPVGTTEKVVRPILEAEFAARGLGGTPRVAHCYERVMPGPRYLDSIRSFWRTYAGVDELSRARAAAFLRTIIDTRSFPLHEVGDTQSSELAKLLENSYRAMNIAFIHEWALAAEGLGINLFQVVDAIRVRKGTHDNMRYPGFGVGGYCLTKDSLLAQWSLQHLWDCGVRLELTLEALRINYAMPRHALQLLEELTGGVRARRVALLGVSYLPEVPDTRNSPSELFVADLLAAGAQVAVHDPWTAHWPELPDIPVLQDLDQALAGADAVVLATPHRAYRDLPPGEWVRRTRPGMALVDAMNILTDEAAEMLHREGRRLAGVGKGHWRMKGYHL